MNWKSVERNKPPTNGGQSAR